MAPTPFLERVVSRAGPRANRARQTSIHFEFDSNVDTLAWFIELDRTYLPRRNDPEKTSVKSMSIHLNRLQPTQNPIEPRFRMEDSGWTMQDPGSSPLPSMHLESSILD